MSKEDSEDLGRLTRSIEITKAHVVVQEDRPDTCYLYIKLPGAMWPTEELLTFVFCAARGTGADYCRANFPGLVVEVANDHSKA